MTKYCVKILTVACSAVLLVSCTSVKKELGVGRNSPDEFSVVKRAPLSLPPDYDLRPPMSGSTPPAATASAQAKAVLVGKTETSDVSTASGDQLFLAKLGADKSDPNVRALVDQENGFIALKNRSVSEKLIFWDNNAPSDEKVPTSVVDPKKEQERLQKNKEEGKPVNDGKVPVIEKKKGTLDKIF